MDPLSDLLAGLEDEYQASARKALFPFDTPAKRSLLLPLLSHAAPGRIKAVLQPVGRLPILVLGASGTGKTGFIAERAVFLLLSGIPPEEILILASTRSGVSILKESLRRILTLVASDAPMDYKGFAASLIERLPNLRVSTIQAEGVRIYRGGMGKAPEGSGRDIMDPSERVSLAAEAAGRAGMSMKPSHLSRLVCLFKAGIPGTGGHEGHPILGAYRRLPALLSEYDRLLARRSLIDPDDIIPSILDAAEGHPDPDTVLGRRPRLLLVDEFEETTYHQFRFLRLLSGGFAGSAIAGDPDGTLFAYRGADERNIERLIDGWSPIVIRFGESLRSSPVIVASAEALLTGRLEGEAGRAERSGERILLYAADDEEDEAAFIAFHTSEILSGGRVSPGRIGVIARSSRFLPRIELALKGAGIGTYSEDLRRLLLSPDLSGIIAALGLYPVIRKEDPSDPEIRYLFRGLISSPWLGLDRSDMDSARSLGGGEIKKGLDDILSGEDGDIFPRKVRSALRKVFLVVTDRRSEGILDRFRSIFRVDISPLERVVSDRLSGRAAADPALIAEAANEYLRGTNAPDEVLLSTIHSVKGRSFDTVFVAACDDGIIPPEGAETGDERERRILHNALLRAERALVLTYPKRRTEDGKIRRPSPFIALIPGHLLSAGG